MGYIRSSTDIHGGRLIGVKASVGVGASLVLVNGLYTEGRTTLIK